MFPKDEDFMMMKALGEATSALRDAMRHFVQRRLREQDIDLTFEMLQVVLIIMEKGPLNQQDIANQVSKDKASITYLINNLSKRKLVIRRKDKLDGRNKIIHLTKAGEDLETKVVRIVKELYKVAGQDLSSDSFRRVTKSLMAIKANLEAPV